VGKKIVVTGRGGTGKSTFTALAVRCLDSPPLLIDADPDQSLASMLGVDLQQEGINTISDALYQLQDRNSQQELQSMRLKDKIEYLLHLSCLYESEAFDLLSLGVKWTKGCYCQPNNILRSLIPELAGSYAYTIVDSPAGLEHLNRRVVDRVDDAFVIMDPASKSVRNLERLRDIAAKIGIQLRNIYLVANHRFTDETQERLREVEGGRYLGKLEQDQAVLEYDWHGRSLLELPDDSPACTSVRAILKEAGYPLRARPEAPE